jgi:hypothetical protein
MSPGTVKRKMKDNRRDAEDTEERRGRKERNIKSCVSLRYLCDLRASAVRILAVPVT